VAPHRAQRPVQVHPDIGLNYLHGTFANDERLVAAGTVIAVAPLIALFACLQRYFFPGRGRRRRQGLRPSRAELPANAPPYAQQNQDPDVFCRALRRHYTPSQGWFHHWLDFDLDSVRADLDSIAALGLDQHPGLPAVAVLQPNRTLIRPKAVEQLVQLADAAASATRCQRGRPARALEQLRLPAAWTRTWHRRNLFTDPDVLDGQAAYLRTLAAALADGPTSSA